MPKNEGKDNKMCCLGLCTEELKPTRAGGNETAQISVAEKGIATTSEKYTIAHSKHVGLKFFALKWQNLQMDDDDERSSSEDLTYRGINRRTEEQQPGSQDPQKPASHA